MGPQPTAGRGSGDTKGKRMVYGTVSSSSKLFSFLPQKQSPPQKKIIYEKNITGQPFKRSSPINTRKCIFALVSAQGIVLEHTE